MQQLRRSTNAGQNSCCLSRGKSSPFNDLRRAVLALLGGLMISAPAAMAPDGDPNPADDPEAMPFEQKLQVWQEYIDSCWRQRYWEAVWRSPGELRDRGILAGSVIEPAPSPPKSPSPSKPLPLPKLTPELREKLRWSAPDNLMVCPDVVQPDLFRRTDTAVFSPAEMFQPLSIEVVDPKQDSDSRLLLAKMVIRLQKDPTLEPETIKRLNAIARDLAPEISAIQASAAPEPAPNPPGAGKIQNDLPGWLWFTGLLCAILLFRLTIRFQR